MHTFNGKWYPFHIPREGPSHSLNMQGVQRVFLQAAGGGRIDGSDNKRGHEAHVPWGEGGGQRACFPKRIEIQKLGNVISSILAQKKCLNNNNNNNNNDDDDDDDDDNNNINNIAYSVQINIQI